MVTFSILVRIVPIATFLLDCLLYAGRFFQYPRADRAHCDAFWSLWCSVWFNTFSILVRIVPIATFRSPPVASLMRIFQYPRADRAHCDSTAQGEAPKKEILSVSSCGSCPLRRINKKKHAWFYVSFSILVRIVPIATAQPSDAAGPTWSLSVSSCGSCPLRPQLQRGKLLNAILSVSSCGSCPLRPRAIGKSIAISYSFSILVRIVPIATILIDQIINL